MVTSQIASFLTVIYFTQDFRCEEYQVGVLQGTGVGQKRGRVSNFCTMIKTQYYHRKDG